MSSLPPDSPTDPHQDEQDEAALARRRRLAAELAADVGECILDAAREIPPSWVEARSTEPEAGPDEAEAGRAGAEETGDGR